MFWSGSSFLLKRVVGILTAEYNVIHPLDGEISLPAFAYATLIHDGGVPRTTLDTFAMDFNINDFGERPDTIVENLWRQLTNFLV